MQSAKRQAETKELALLVAVQFPHVSEEEIHVQLDELALLADTAGAISEDRIIQRRTKIDAATFIGKGKISSIISQANELKLHLIIFNDELSPTQIKNIQKLAGDSIKILDRTGLILDIFDSHARSKEAKTQIKLARLEYMLPRLTRQWTHLERQMGGVGTRGGPGETQIEIDRRLIRNQITKLKLDLKKIQKQHKTQTQSRDKIYKIALVGYTNAGKSTLMRAITGSDMYIQDQLFATLDTTTRKVDLGGGISFILSDTVGFIRKLPHDLVASFRSTLSEVKDADLILRVCDASSPQMSAHIKTIDQVLKSLDITHENQLVVINKIDLVDDINLISGLKSAYPDAQFISAHKSLKINHLKAKIVDIIKSKFIRKILKLRYDQLKNIDIIYEDLNVISRKDKYNGIEIEVEGDLKTLDKIENLINK
ncbi:MAG: GTPase HflX [Candidatus Marinimicrobia bacterium]|nr:GTPase HflX [Candidatus Neomarinimicrobiota bacterium]